MFATVSIILPRAVGTRAFIPKFSRLDGWLEGNQKQHPIFEILKSLGIGFPAKDTSQVKPLTPGEPLEEGEEAQSHWVDRADRPVKFR